MKFIVLTKGKVVAIMATVLSVIIALAVAVPIGSSQVFGKNTNRLIPIYSVKTDKKQVAISFDCAWGTDYTDKLLEIMKENDIYCTFFAVEFWAEKHADYIKKISDAGHEIGTHSATHPHMSKLDKEGIKRELLTSKEAIERVTGKKVELFRAPFGEYNDRVIETAQELGLFTIQWDVDSLDWKDLSKAEITSRVTKKVKNGSIVLFHNQGKHTAEALDGIIKKLKSDGYEFVRIGDLIYRENYKVLSDGTQVENK